MFFKEDHTFKDIREKSVYQWLDDIDGHEDLLVRGGVKVTREYIESLKHEIQVLEDKNTLKDNYLRKLKSELNEYKKSKIMKA